MKDVEQIDTCTGYGDGIDVFWNEDHIRNAQRAVDEECDAEDLGKEVVVVCIEVPTRRASLDLDGIEKLRSALDKAEAAHRARMNGA